MINNYILCRAPCVKMENITDNIYCWIVIINYVMGKLRIPCNGILDSEAIISNLQRYVDI